ATAAAPKALVGLTTLDVQGTASSSLTRQKVTVGVSAPAQLTKANTTRRVLLPISAGTVATNSQITQTGSLTFARKVKGKRHVVTFSKLRLDLDAKPALSAVVGGKRLDLLALDLRRSEYTATASTSSVRIVSTRASLTKAAAAAIATKLALTSLKPGLLGVLGTTASLPAAGSTSTPGAISPGVTAPTPVVTQTAASLDIAADTLTWHVRESFVQYLAQSGPIQASGGATLGAPVAIGGQPPLIYDATFVPAGGWYDPSTGKALLKFTGTVRFSYPSHGIDITVSDPQIQLAGTDSQVVVTYGGSSASSYTGPGVLATIDPTKAKQTTDGPTQTWTTTPGYVPASSASSVFAGFYAPGDPFGVFTFSLTRAS
ncbi:MAG: HtaA domain-containing protein, partial [Solirubrobacteraceae bacterium]